MKKFINTVFVLLLFSFSAAAQSRAVSGKVVDLKGVPVADASVTISGSESGTSTDAEGLFAINIPAGSNGFIVSSVGFRSKFIALGSSNYYLIELESEDDELTEVVITGYTVTNRNRSPISSSVVGSRDIENIPMANVNDILQGKATGVMVMSTSGQPGSSSNIRVRGVGSISAGASPIYVIDGIIVERGQIVGGLAGFTQNNDILSNLNPNDIESVTVLKDAAALALYGSRGGNGVVVITTKSGRAGTSRLNLTAQYGVTKPSLGNWEMMDANQVYNYEKDLLRINGFTEEFINDYMPASLLDKTFNWVDAAFTKGNIQSYNLSASGGNEKTSHFLSLGFYDQEGTVVGGGFERFSANFSLDHQVFSKLKVGINFNGSFSDALNSDGGSFFSSPILATLTNSPLWLYPYRDDGSLYVGYEDEFSKGSGNNVAGDNFLYSNKLNYNRFEQFRGFSKVYGELQLTNWLSIKQNIGLDLIYSKEKFYFDPTTGNGINFADPSQSGQITESIYNPLTVTSQTSINGNFDIGEKHEIGYLALMEFQKYKNSDFSATGIGIVDGALQVLNVAGTPQTTIGNINEYAFLSYLGQLNYTFNNKYSLSLSARRDGSSRFGAENRFANFYSVGGSWNIAREDFMQAVPAINDFRIKASYGTSGVADFNNYVARQLYAFTTAYDGTPGSAPSTPGNPLLTWEKSAQTNLGLDIGLLNNRFHVVLDFYRRISDDLLQNVPVSRTSGFTTIQSNVGKMENKGYEITIESNNIRNENFTWTTGLNVSYNHNEVLELYNNQNIPGGTLARTTVGRALGSWFLPQWAGVDPATGDPLWYLADKTTTNSYAVASRTENRQYSGSSFPWYVFGLNNSISYKGINLSFFFYAQTGARLYNQTMSLIDSDGLRYGWNYYKDADKDYWREPGQQASRPKPVLGGNKNSASASTRWIEKNDYIRLRNITVSYSLPRDFISKASFNSVRVFVQGTNLLTITNYSGVDPEAALGGNDVFKYPVNKALTAGIDITF